MMSSAELAVSFEFFPPKTKGMAEEFPRIIQRVAALKPEFVSVTYGAGGSTKERTRETVVSIQSNSGLACAAHLTCVGSSRREVDETARSYWKSGIRHIVALRGDAPGYPNDAMLEADRYVNAADLVAGLKKYQDFEISVAGYPETHPESLSEEADLDYLKRKVDSGADRVITQYFFDTDVYWRFLDRVRGAGIDVPIVPGIMPVTNFQQIVKFSAACGTTIPDWLARLFQGLEGDSATRKAVAINVAVDQCRALRTNGVNTFHFYTLNRADVIFAICHLLGVRTVKSPYNKEN